MSRKRTGLRNRFRTGRSTYSAKAKTVTADRYGQWNLGRQERPDVIGGHQLAYRTRPEERW